MTTLVRRFLDWFNLDKHRDPAAVQYPDDPIPAPASGDPIADWIAEQDAAWAASPPTETLAPAADDFVIDDIQLPPSAAVHFSKPAE